MNINSPLCGLALPEKTERDNRKECQRLCRRQSEPNSVHTGEKWDDKKARHKEYYPARKRENGRRKRAFHTLVLAYGSDVHNRQCESDGHQRHTVSRY